MLTPGLEPVERLQTQQAGLGRYQEMLLLIGPTVTGTQQLDLLQLPLEIVLRLKKERLEAGTMLGVANPFNMCAGKLQSLVVPHLQQRQQQLPPPLQQLLQQQHLQQQMQTSPQYDSYNY